MNLALNHRVSRHPDLIFAQMGEEVVMMTEDQDDYLGLNNVASDIWRWLEEPMAIHALCEKLQEKYAVEPARCQTEVLEFLAEMKQKKLIEVVIEE